MRWDEGCRAVLVFERDIGGVSRPDRVRYRLQAIGPQIPGRQYGEHRRRRERRSAVVGAYFGMRVRRADHHRISLTRKVEVVAIAAPSGQQPEILSAPDRLPYSCIV